MTFISVDPSQSSLKEVHNLLLGGVTPRPIALVSTISEAGIMNLAPFSFFNAFGANPPYVAFSPAYSGRDGSPKDTLLNLEKIPQCVIHAVPYELIHQTSLASSAYSPDINEFEKAGFTAIDSDIVKPKRVKESPFHMECEVEQIIPLGGINGSGNLILCRVVRFHVAEEVMHDGIIDPQLIRLVGRNSSSYYTKAFDSSIFSLSKPASVGIGIDQLPQHIRESKILSANNLGQLGGVSEIPDDKIILAFINDNRVTEKLKHEEVAVIDDYRLLFAKGLSLAKSGTSQTNDLIHKAARSALDADDIDFALKALLSIQHL